MTCILIQICQALCFESRQPLLPLRTELDASSDYRQICVCMIRLGRLETETDITPSGLHAVELRERVSFPRRRAAPSTGVARGKGHEWYRFTLALISRAT
jgi:hypothetical protein